MEPDALAAWLTLIRLPGVGTRGRKALLEHFDADIHRLFRATRLELAAALEPIRTSSTHREAIAAVLAGPDPDALSPDLAWLEQPGHHLVTWVDPDYPPRLREIADAPVALFVRGRREALCAAQLAVVGSRNASASGAHDAQAFAQALAACGLAITSGLALGIDAAAHRGALAGGGQTLAVVAHGLDAVYPKRHQALAAQIAESGALVSEYPVGTPPLPEHFPVRNRLISGLSLGVLVIEAATHSGSLITARLAAEYGREVFALPGSIHSPLARGCHALIRDGAKLVETVSHVLEELAPLIGARTADRVEHHAPVATDLGPEESRLYALIGHEPIHVDRVIEYSGLTPDSVSSILLSLELRGLVQVGPGGAYHRAP